MDTKRTLTTALTALLVLTLAAPFIAYTEPRIVGADESRVVLSGSMEPAIETGDVILVSKTPIENVEIGDVVTFRAHASTDTTYTHRVVDVNHDERGTVLTTKGDANENPDPMGVNDEMLIGTVDHTIPKLGIVVGALQSQLLPHVLVVLSLLTIGHEATRLLGLNEEPELDVAEAATDSASTFEAVKPP